MGRVEDPTIAVGKAPAERQVAQHLVVAHVGDAGDHMAAFLELVCQPAQYAPGIDEVLQHIPAEDRVVGPGEIGQVAVQIHAPHLVQMLSGLAERL